jgi:hypothetical protein
MVDRLNRLMAKGGLKIRGRLAPDRWTVFGSRHPVAPDAATAAAGRLSNL